MISFPLKSHIQQQLVKSGQEGTERGSKQTNTGGRNYEEKGEESNFRVLNVYSQGLTLYLLLFVMNSVLTVSCSFMGFLKRYLEKKANGDIKPRSIQHLPEERRQQLREQWRASKARCRRRKQPHGVPLYINTMSLPYGAPE